VENGEPEQVASVNDENSNGDRVQRGDDDLKGGDHKQNQSDATSDANVCAEPDKAHNIVARVRSVIKTAIYHSDCVDATRPEAMAV
jgi:hypothetical protein